MKNHYNISQYLIIKKSQFDSKVNLSNIDDATTSDALSIEYFNPENGKKLDSKFCSNITTKFSLPIKNIKRINMDLYKVSQTRLRGVDIYNKNSPSFNSRCYRSEDFETGGDTSITFRKTKLYQNESMGCSEGCEYNGIDENDKIICDCKISENQEISNNNTVFDAFVSLPKLNYDIVYCYKETLDDVNF